LINSCFQSLVFLCSAAFFIACGETEDESLPVKANNKPNQEGWNSKVIISTKGVMDAELFYTHMMRWEQPPLTTFNHGVRLDFYEKGKHNATLTADSGEIKNNTNSFLAIGHVVVTSDSGVSMHASKLFWDDRKQRVFADGFVTMTTEEDTLNGYDFESDRNLTNWKMRNAFGQSSRDVDLKSGTIKSKKDSKSESNKDLDKAVNDILKEKH